MATRIYFLKSDSSIIKVRVEPIAIGIVSTVIQLKKSGGSVVEVGDSGKDATGTVRLTAAGKSSELLNAVMVVSTAVDLAAVPKNQWDKVFEDLRIKYHLEGGIDGAQDFNVDNDDKIQIMEKKIILASKAIKFNTHDF